MKIGLWAIAAALGLAIELTPAVADDDLDALLGASADEAPSATRPATDTSGDKAAPAPKTTDVTSDAQADASEDAAAESPAPLATIPVAIKDEKKAPLIAPPKSRGPQLEEIVVTAQKREENLQEVPVAVSAFTAAQLKNISFNDVSNLVGYVPSLNVGTNVSPLSTSFRIRNIGKFSSIPSFEPAVGLFIDGAFRARSGLGLGDLVDVSSIEILKGPQSTLYGKNVSAGVISVNTQAPTREFEGMIETTVGDYNLRQFKGYVSGPLSERFSARLSAVSTRAGPHMQNLVGIAEDDRGSDAIRGQLLFNVTDQLSSRLIVGYVHKDLHPKQGDVFYSPAVTEIIRDAGGQVTNNDPRDGIVEYSGFNRFRLRATDIIWNNKYDNGDWSLTSISSYDEYDALSQLYDVAQMSLRVATYDDTQRGNTFSQELRFDTQFGDKLKFLGGLYYYKNRFVQGDPAKDEFVLEDQIADLGNAVLRYITVHTATGSLPIPGLDPSLLPNPRPVQVPLIGVAGDRGNYLAILDTDAIGVFSKVDLSITDVWDASLGLRYSSENKDGKLTQSLQLSPLGCIPPLNSNFICAVTPQDNNFAKKKRYSAVTYSAQTRYHPYDDTMVYASYSTGFKSGGFSMSNGVAPPESRPYNSEDIKSYEIGWKSELWDRRARVNGALFYTVYNDFQEASTTGLYFIVNSAEKVSVQGIEVESSVIATDNLTVGLDMAYVDSKYDTYTQGLCYYGRAPTNAQGSCDISGQQLPLASRFNGLFSLQWESDFFGGSIYSRGDYVYRSSFNASSELDPRFNEEAIKTINVKVGWRNERLDISVGGKNITDVRYVDQKAAANVLTPIDRAVGSPVGSYQNYIGDRAEWILTLRVNY